MRREKFMAEQKMTKDEAIQGLEKLVQEPCFIYSLAVVLQHDFFLNPEEAADINWRDHLSFQEANFLSGLLVKQKIDLTHIPTEEESKKQISKMYELFQELHKAHSWPFIERIMVAIKEPFKSHEEAEKSYHDFFGSGDMMIEPIFYGGSGAYDFQYLDFAEKKYVQDKEWIFKNTGIDIPTVCKIATDLKKLHEHKNMTSPRAKSFEEFCQNSFDVFCFRKEDIAQLGEEAANNFLTMFVTEPGKANQSLDSLGAYNELDSRPIIAISENLYFLPIGFMLTQSIYESPFYWMGADKNYCDTAFKHRGETTEQIACELLESVFGRENVYRNVKVLKNKKELVTDIDVLAIAGNKAVIVQAKSKKLTELSRRGDEEKLKSDFKEAVQKAYDQGLACRSAIVDTSNILIAEDGKELKLSEFIDNAYIICVTSDHYPAITHQVDIYLKKKPEDPYPLAMSIFDLDIVAFYLKNPFEFLYYLRQRVRWSDYFKASSEMALLGNHLRRKLYPSPEADREMLAEEFAQLIDANFPAMKGHHPKTSAVEKLHTKWKNDKFQELVEQVKSSREAGFTDAIFYLYDLAGEGADDLIRVMEQTKEKTRQDKQLHDFSMIFEKGKSGVTFISLPGTPEQLEKRLMVHAVSKKYQTKAEVWLALGSIFGSPNLVDAIAFNKEPWKEDKELEEISKVALKKGIQIGRGGKKIGRNDPCYCGSGKKYKKCCGR